MSRLPILTIVSGQFAERRRESVVLVGRRNAITRPGTILPGRYAIPGVLIFPPDTTGCSYEVDLTVAAVSLSLSLWDEEGRILRLTYLPI
jgi:hypothetical protein